MVVALSALHTNPQKNLSDVFKLVFAVANRAIPDDGWIGAGFSGSGEKLARDLVIGLVFIDGVSEPLMKGNRASGVFRFSAFIAEDGGPFSGEIISVVWRREKLFDFLRPLVGFIIDQKSVGFLDARKTSCDIDRDTPEESGVVALFGWRKPESLELSKDVLVDEVRGLRKVVDGSPQREDRAEDIDVFLEADHDGG